MQRHLTIRLTVLLAATGILGACDADVYEPPRGDPTTAVVTLDENHPGWRQADCAACHAPHGDAYTVEQCSACHGGNGEDVQPATHDTPQLDADHTGWQMADCATCHSLTGTHGGAYDAPSCGVCHGSNGGPLRPPNHWLTDCNDCHASGPYAWSACSHLGYDLDVPRACRYCHR